jgi:hypothetical protein
MGHWGAEQRHDTVAEYLVNDAFVAMDGIHHTLRR